MALQPVATYAATASPPSGTSVSFLASIDFNGQTVPINTGDISNGIKNLVFSLSSPVDIGSIANFLNYLNTNLGLPLSWPELDGYIQQIPDDPAFLGDFKNAIEQIATTDLIITVLNINVAAGTFTLGVSFPIDLQLTSFLTINSIGVLVNKPGTTTSP
ncbi:hypothetical protein [Mangrovicella endophytica]|uniref:hypothetical protein n=1 Tax=Mangrovicella endophytica TaxID=2066697 RepID=UPI000C9E7203|nr:hypothetical protein [Mangrovicella endophytica]